MEAHHLSGVLDSFEHSFLCSEFPHAVFYKIEYALRFELGGEDVSTSRPLKRFIQAFDRGKTVAAELFGGSQSVWMLTSEYGGAKPRRKRLKPYKVCGLKRMDFQHLGAVSQRDNPDIDDEDGELFRHWDAVELTDRDQLNEVLWLALGGELGIQPASGADIYFVDFSKGLVLHPYDDRGMDVASIYKEDLSSLYKARKDWLLEYEMERMQALFEV